LEVKNSTNQKIESYLIIIEKKYQINFELSPNPSVKPRDSYQKMGVELVILGQYLGKS
jgi:hypothetical protein